MQGHWECPPKMNKCQPVLRDSGLRRGCLRWWITDRWHTAGWGSLRRRKKVSFPSYLLRKALQQEYPHLPTLEDEGKKGKSVLCSEGREEQQRRAWLWQQRCLGEDSRPITSLTLGPWTCVLVPSSLVFLLCRLGVQVIIIPTSRGSLSCRALGSVRPACTNLSKWQLPSASPCLPCDPFRNPHLALLPEGSSVLLLSLCPRISR